MSSTAYLYWDGATPAGVVRDWPECCSWLTQHVPSAFPLTQDKPARNLTGEIVKAFLADDEPPRSVEELLLAVLSRPQGAKLLATAADEGQVWEPPQTIPERAAAVSQETWNYWDQKKRGTAYLLLEIHDALTTDPDEDDDRDSRLAALLQLLISPAK